MFTDGFRLYGENVGLPSIRTHYFTGFLNMPNIVGPFRTLFTSMSPVEAHAAHLRHLSSSDAAQRLLRDKFAGTHKNTRKSGAIISAHVGQALEFYEIGLKAPWTIRPVLQYYCYLNLAIAVVAAYRPNDFPNCRRHGVTDKSHLLSSVDLDSILVRVKERGAIPLFHSLISGDGIENRSFPLKQLFGAIRNVQFELSEIFNISLNQIWVLDDIVRDGEMRRFRSQVAFQRLGSDTVLSKPRIEKAMPDLVDRYDLKSRNAGLLLYQSQMDWDTIEDASQMHRANCMRLINYGGGFVVDQDGDSSLKYIWHGVPDCDFVPTLTATLILSFGLASICRYRPRVARFIEDSELYSLLDIFIREADSTVFPAMRNLLFREELVFEFWKL